MTNLNNTIQLKPSSIIPYPSEKPSSSEKPTPSAKPSSQIPPHPKESSTSEPKTSGGEQSQAPSVSGTAQKPCTDRPSAGSGGRT